MRSILLKQKEENFPLNLLLVSVCNMLFGKTRKSPGKYI